MRKAQIEFFTVVSSLRPRCLSKDSQELFRRSEIERLEWEQRRIEIQKQSLEVQRLKKRKRAGSGSARASSGNSLRRWLMKGCTAVGVAAIIIPWHFSELCQHNNTGGHVCDLNRFKMYLFVCAGQIRGAQELADSKAAERPGARRPQDCN